MNVEPLTLPLTLTVAETAEQLRVSDRTVFNLINRGELISIKVGNRRRIPRQALIDYLEKLGEPVIINAKAAS